MQIVPFIADNAADALAQIHERLGPDAVVLSVRRLPASGVARLWHRAGRIEVLAGVPDDASPTGAGQRFMNGEAADWLVAGSPENGGCAGGSSGSRRWRTLGWLEAMGLMPAHVERLQTRLEALHPSPPVTLEAEWSEVSTALAGFWQDPPPLAMGTGRPHVFIGPPASGKTTVLCKWLTLAVLMEERSARVWRLDGHVANTAEFLTVHCEMLDTPVERIWSAPGTRSDLYFVDLPGVESDDSPGLSALQERLTALPSPHVHVVLNAAYETPVLLNQWRTFTALEPEDLIFTHLDEETRGVKLWNLILGTNCRIRFLSAGQKVPGEFRSATPDLLLPAGFHRK
jgi:flagellar biosynthesis GTPase FlhF